MFLHTLVIITIYMIWSLLPQSQKWGKNIRPFVYMTFESANDVELRHFYKTQK